MMLLKLTRYFLSALLALPAVVLAQEVVPADVDSLIELREPEGGLQVGLVRLVVTITPVDGLSAPMQRDAELAVASVSPEKLLPAGVVFKQSFYPNNMPREGGPRRVVQSVAFSIAGKELKSSLANDLADRYAAAVRALTAPNASMGLEQRTAHIKELDEKQADLKQRIDALEALNQAQGKPVSLLSERLKRLREDKQRLEMELAGKSARRDALMRAVNEQREVAAKARDEDAIANELRKLLKMREDEAAMKKAMVSRGLYTASEGAAADVPVSEAKIRLAEREASLGKSGKGELLDRLSDELTLVTVDMTDLEIQRAGVRDELKLYDPKSLDAAGLDRLLKETPQLRTPDAESPSPLLTDLYNQTTQIERDRFALQAGQITVKAISVATEKELRQAPRK